ncbi:hypothetical protein Tcan_18038 [Toxocara canis]|uniref:Uncharacterized protein n=1 Tax=Toxocara canis TaxID=6265 RepID=A0A0B2VD86_TOXCA|nr:hypothetical protein Tcan_18038 [Toxocara canis]
MMTSLRWTYAVPIEMANDGQSPSTSLWLPTSLREESFSISQPVTTLEETSETDGVHTIAPTQSSNLSVRRGISGDGDSLIVIDVDSDADSSAQLVPGSTARHRPGSNGSVSSIASNQEEETRSDASAEEQSIPDRGSSAFFHSMLNRLGLLMHDSEVQEVMAVVLINVVPLAILVLCKVIIANFAALFTIVMGSACFNMANLALLACSRGRRYLHVAQSTFFVQLFIVTVYFIYGKFCKLAIIPK